MQTREITTTELKGGAYLALPDGSGPHPGVVVIHEAYGLNDNMKDISRRLAAAGFGALAVDLFSGRVRAVCMARYMARMLTGSIHSPGIDDLKTALTFLAKRPEIDAQRLGAIGFCMGGGFAIAWACTDSRLKAIAPFYATNPRPLDVTKRLQVVEELAHGVIRPLLAGTSNERRDSLHLLTSITSRSVCQTPQ